MAKVKIPLIMKNGEKAKDMESLRENFDVETVVGYFLDGKLSKWLNDRYYEEEAEAVAQLERDDPHLASKLCNILGVEYNGGDAIDTEEIIRQKERLAHLRQLTDDEEILRNIDCVAFDQEELAELYDRGVETIYLCEGNFKIPKSKQELNYTLVGEPVVEGLKDLSSKDLSSDEDHQGADDFAPKIVEYRGLDADAMKNGLIPILGLLGVLGDDVISRRAIVNEIPVDLSEYRYMWLLGYTKQFLILSAVREYFRKVVLVIDRNTGAVRSLNIDFRGGKLIGDGARFVNGTDKYLLIAGRDLYLYDIENDNLKILSDFFYRCTSREKKSAFYHSDGKIQTIKIINLETGEVECTIPLPRTDIPGDMLLTESGIYCGFPSDTYPERSAELYYFDFAAESPDLLFRLHPGDDKISISSIYTSEGDLYFVVYSGNGIDDDCIDVYKLLSSKEVQLLFSKEYIDNFAFYTHYAIFSKDCDIFAFDLCTCEERKIAKDATDGFFKIVDGYLYFEIEDYDEDGDLVDIPHRILLSDPNLTPEKSPSRV